MNDILVIGSGLAALRTVENLRSFGWTGGIVVLGNEVPCNRPPLSKAVLVSGDTDALALPRVHADSATWRTDVTVTGLSDDLRGVLLSDGAEVRGVGLVLATGVRPRQVLPESAATHVVRTPDDTEKLRRTLGPGRRLLVLGAGFLGCEIATSARALGAEVLVVEPAATPLAPLGTIIGTRAAARLRSLGIEVLTETSVSSVDGAGEAHRAVLSDGREEIVDAVVEAVGALPNVEAFTGHGLNLDNGVLALPDLRVLQSGEPVDHVVTAGDVARFPLHGFDADPRRIEHWNLAFDTAKVAAHTLLTHLGHTVEATAPTAPLPSFWCEYAGGRLDALGIPGLGRDDVRVVEGDPDNHDGPLVLEYRDPSGRVVGAVFCDTRKGMAQLRRAMNTDLCAAL